MKNGCLRLPWHAQDVPHAVLDILRGCNIRCRDCYNLLPDQIKPLDEIEAQLDGLIHRRRLQSVSIVGGEITLHPDLVEIVRRVRRRGLFAELFSNGVDLGDELLARLRRAGANVIFLHIEPGQRRPDLPACATAEDVRRLRKSLAARVAAHGIEAGLAATAYRDRLDEVEAAVALALEAPEISYLLITWRRDVGAMPLLTGDLDAGLSCDPAAAPGAAVQAEISPDELCHWLGQRFGLTPFAFLGSNIDPADPRWLSFLVGTAHRRGTLVRHLNIRPTIVERAFLGAVRRLSGRYPFYQQQHRLRTGLHLALNGLTSGSPILSFKLIALACLTGGRLGAKRLLFQWPASLDPRGRVIHCAHCPDAVLKAGGLVPLCISDRIRGRPSAAPLIGLGVLPSPIPSPRGE